MLMTKLRFSSPAAFEKTGSEIPFDKLKRQSQIE